MHETDKWLVFPHELQGLSEQEIKLNKPELKKLIGKITPHIKSLKKENIEDENN
mgnify:FL=1